MKRASTGAIVCAIIALALGLGCEDIPAETPSCFGIPDVCGIHGRCDLATDSCICNRGYAGPGCHACAPGYQDVNANGFCAPACGNVTCAVGGHEQCVESSGRAACGCVPGYSRTRETACSFTGGPIDPELDSPATNAWRTDGAVTIDPGSPPNISGAPGWARFSGDGEISQSFVMPSYEDAEPLALLLDLQCTDFGNCRSVKSFSFSIDGEERQISPRPSSVDLTPPTTPFGRVGQTSICLGERAFGRSLRLGLRTSRAPFTRDVAADDLFLGSVRVFSWPFCAQPGTVLNGSFDSGSWLEMTPATATTELDAIHGSMAGRMFRTCSADASPAWMRTNVSVPMVLDAPALVFSIEGTKSGLTEVRLDEQIVGTVVGTGTWSRVVVCIPPWARGFAPDLRVEAMQDSTCAIQQNNVRLDDVVLGSDSSCTTSH